MNKVIVSIVIIFALVSSAYSSEKAYERLAIAQRKIEKRQKELSNEIVITDHAWQQMEDRDISINEIERAIKYGTRVVNKADKSIKYTRDNVVVVMDPSGRRVITLYPTHKTEEQILSKKERSIRSKKEKQKIKGPRSNLTEETKSFVRTLNP